MSRSAHDLLQEFEAEVPATRRVLERVPADRLSWRPHEKSFSLGQLAQHVATIPAGAARLAGMDGFDVAHAAAEYPSSESASRLMETFEASVEALRGFLRELEEGRALQPWRLHFGDRTLADWTRAGVIRTMGLNHWYHHRGELVVYLRLLDVPVPVVYGRSADENPFARPAA
jgi:uncharacterized damage-inducible protein DinB